MSTNEVPKGLTGVPVTLYYKTDDPKKAILLAQKDMAVFLSLAIEEERKMGRPVVAYEGLMIGEGRGAHSSLPNSKRRKTK